MLAFTCVATAEAGIVLEARIQDLDGKGTPGFVVKAVREETRVSCTAVTAELGTAILRLTGNGLYSVTVWKPDYAACEVRIDVSPGERRVMRFSADPQRRAVHLESESRDLRDRPPAWLSRVGVSFGAGMGGYGPDLITLNQKIHPRVGMTDMRSTAQLAGEIQVRVDPYLSIGMGLENWTADATAGSTRTVTAVVVNLQTGQRQLADLPASLDYMSQLNLKMFPIALRLMYPLGRTRLGMLVAVVPVRGEYQWTQTLKIGGVINPQILEGRIAAGATGTLWRVGAELSHSFTRHWEATFAGFYTMGRLRDWLTTEYYGRSVSIPLEYRDSTGLSQPFVAEMSGPGVKLGLGLRL